MDGRTDRPKPICPHNFSEVGGIKTTNSLQKYLTCFNSLTGYRNSIDVSRIQSIVIIILLLDNLLQTLHFLNVFSFFQRNTNLVLANEDGINEYYNVCFIQ